MATAMPPLDAAARRRAEEQGWDLRLLDPEDADERSLLIRLAHPELDDAISQGRDEIDIGGEPMNPRLHLTIHEIVAAQIIDDDPPEALATAARLLELGRDHHEVLHMLGSVVTQQIWTVTHEHLPYRREEHVAALAALPGSWDAQIRPRARVTRSRRHRRR